MNILSKIIKLKQTTDTKLEELINIQNHIDDLLTNNEYIAKSAYSTFLSSSKDYIEYFQIIKESGMLKRSLE